MEWNSVNGEIWFIKILNISLFCTGKYKHEFTDTDRAREVHVNWTSASISHCKTRKRLLFDLLKVH